MRRRIVALLVLMLGGALVALSVPLAMYSVSARGRAMYLDRLQDTTRFASVAEQADTTANLLSLTADMLRFREVYAVAAAILDREGRVIAGSADWAGPWRDDARASVRLALAGHDSPEPDGIWPGEPAPLIVAVPIVHGGDVIGAAVTLSSTATLRRWVGMRLQLLALADLGVLGVCVLVAFWLATWVLRPVSTLDGAAHRIAGGDLASRVAVTQGPVELRRLAGSFNHMAAEVERTVCRQRNFAMDASHQLRNPLTAMNLRLEMLAGLIPESPETGRELAEVRREADRLREVVDSLLDLASARYVFAERATTVDLAALVADRITSWQAMATSKNVVLVARSEGGQAYADWSLLSSAVDAVLDNAIRYSRTGGRVEVACGISGDRARLTVTDAGPGLRPGEFARIGNRFWRSPRNPNVPGSGLGLAIVRESLEVVNGRLDFEPAPPHGLRVIMTLPVSPDQAASDQTAPADDPAKASA